MACLDHDTVLERLGQGDRVVVTWPSSMKASDKASYRLAGGGRFPL